MEGSAGPRMSKIWMVPLAALALANVGFAIARIVDAVNAHAGRLPRFSLLLPMWIRPESRFTELIVLGAMPALSCALPILAVAAGVVDFIRRRRAGRPRLWSIILIVLGAACLAANAITSYVIYRSVPSFG